MSYRNGTYIAFHADGTNVPGRSDIDYYMLMRAWSANPDDEFAFVNSHEKVGAVRDSSKRETLRRSLVERLRNSKNLVLIIGETTRFDTDWVPFEIAEAVDRFSLPIIAAYPGAPCICEDSIWSTATTVLPMELKRLWPPAFTSRVREGSIRAIHIPFKKHVVQKAINHFSIGSPPIGAVSYYKRSVYQKLGLID